jgi:AcrR family transcriptional regulator
LAVKDGSVDGQSQPVKRGRGRPPVAPEELEAAHAAARNKICDGALILFDRGGIEAISMREIAAQIGVSAMMTYKYFPTKDHLLQELRTRAFQHLEKAMLAVGATSTNTHERLEQQLLACLRFGLEERRAYRLMFDYWVYDNPGRMVEDFGDAIHRQAGAWNIVLASVKAYFREAGGTGDPVTAAHLIWASVHGLVSLEASRKLVMGKQFEELMLPMVAAIMAGLTRCSKAGPAGE